MTIFCLLITGWFGESGSGHKTTVTRALRDFTAVELQSSLDAEVHEGDTFAVAVTIDDNLQALVMTEVKNGVLVVSTKKSLSYHGKARVQVTLPKLSAARTNASGDLNLAVGSAHDVTIETSGSGDIHFAGPLQKLTAQSNGSGDIVLDILGSADTLTLSTHGSGDITLRSGKANRLEVTINGSGEVDAARAQVQLASFVLSGSGDVSAHVEGEVSNATLRGSGDLELVGKASVVKQSVQGSGEIRRR